jgi:hypothetical protein
MKFACRSIVLVLVLSSGAFSDLHSQSAHAPFMVGVLQSDGVLIPVARFEAGKWTAPWPEGDGVAHAKNNLLLATDDLGRAEVRKSGQVEGNERLETWLKTVTVRR